MRFWRLESTPEEPDEVDDEVSSEGYSDDAIGELHRELAGSLERLAWSMLRDWPMAADAVQDAFTLFSEKFRDQKCENARGWLVRTVQFQSLNLRKKQQRSEVGSELVREQFEKRPALSDASDRLQRQEELDEIQDALASLSESQRSVLRMRLNEEKTFARIAEELGIPIGTVLSRMHAALAKIRSKMKP